MDHLLVSEAFEKEGSQRGLLHHRVAQQLYRKLRIAACPMEATFKETSRRTWLGALDPWTADRLPSLLVHLQLEYQEIESLAVDRMAGDGRVRKDVVI